MCGHVLPVMNTVEKWASKVDQSLIRHFIVQVLESIEPPYSAAFVSVMLRLIERPASIDALKSLKAYEQKHLVLHFIEHCIASGYPWEDVQKSTLQKLRETFSSGT